LRGIIYVQTEKRLERILTMVYAAHFFGLYESSGIYIYDKNSQHFGDWICLRPQVDGAG
jgi:hypothetical protein